MCLNAKWLGRDLTDPASQDFVERLLNHMRERLSDYQEKYAPELFNLEATPAESTAYRFAKHDTVSYPGIQTANMNGTPYYTNSTNLPVGTTADVFDALDVQDRFQPLYTSGTVFHTFLGEKLPTWQSAATLVRKICDNYRLPYVSISPTYSICPDHGYITGEHFKCPICGRETEVYSRITGYYRPVKNWNDGKAQEFKDRQVYDAKISFASAPHSHHPQVEECPSCTVQEVKSQVKEEAAPVEGSETLTLLTTSTCPKCKLIKAYMDGKSIPYQVEVAGDPEADDLIRRYDISVVPTLVVRTPDFDQTFSDMASIKAFLEQEYEQVVR